MSPILLEHKAALPWLSYDCERERITFRLACCDGVQSAVLLWGDPYDRRGAADGSMKWHYEAEHMRPQFCGSGSRVFRARIDTPASRRVKYAFRARTKAGDVFFGENGAEPFDERALDRTGGHFFFPFAHGIDAPRAPEWAQRAVWYQIFPERFRRGAGGAGGGRGARFEDWETGKPSAKNFFGGNIAGIIEKLPWIAELGASALYLNPVFASPSNHKYNVEDYFAVDAAFGSAGDLKALVARAHELGMKVMLDAVFNHAGDTHPFWLDVLERQEKSPYKDFFHVRRFPARRPAAGDPPRDLDYHAFAWVGSMPKWNTENPSARKYLLDSAAHWIRECDIDGWRLDVANEVSMDFWREFSRTARALKKDFYIVGEIWHDASAWINSGLFDAAMNYPLGSAISDCFLEGKASPREFTRRLFAVLARYGDMHNRAAFNLLDSHDTERALTRAGGDKLALRNAFAMMFLLPGAPCVYYGTEIGMEGGADPDCRRPMVWDEKKQDGELRRFFMELAALREKYFHIISDAEISHREIERGSCAVHRWEFARGGESLVALYAQGEGAPDFEEPGACVLKCDPKRAGAGLSPRALSVYYGRKESA